jgi:lysophospholipase L1-like esterase
VPWLEQDGYDWYARHHAEMEAQKSLTPRVVMVGDSITHFWGGLPNGNPVHGQEAWDRLTAAAGGPMLNMGFGWDRTQNVLWRLRQGEFSGLAPDWIVLMIGTNNLTGTEHARASTPEEIVAAIEAICAEVHRESPHSRVVVMGILPRGLQPNHRLREPIRQTNALLAAHFRDDRSVVYADIGEKFLLPDGSLPKTLMPDGTHPSAAGYDLWADALIRIFETGSKNPSL